MPRINVERIEQDIIAISQFGRQESDRGAYRQGFSPADMEARPWLREQFGQLGMAHRMDGAGNVIGRYGPEAKPAIIIGSHLDSVPAGGMFDGVLGVAAGLEVVRALHEKGIAPDFPIEVIATSEEEGRFGGMLGAQAMTGHLTREWLETACDEHGYPLKNAMEAAGLEPFDALHA